VGAVRLLGLSGSLRRASLNTRLLHLAAELAPADVEVVVHPLGDLPFYDGDLEASGVPASVRALREAIAAADGLLLASPEYNRSTSAVLKNALDWASRRRPDSPLDGQVVGLLSAAGGGGGRGAQQHLRDVLSWNTVTVVDESFQLARAATAFDDDGLADEAHRAQLADVVNAVADAARRRRAALSEVA
jgi:chromate reductase